MFTISFKPWAFIATMMAIRAVSCTGGGQGGSGYDDPSTDSVFKVEHSQELDCGHVQDMEMMAINKSN